MLRIKIVVEGGIVQGVYANRGAEKIEVSVIDRDDAGDEMADAQTKRAAKRLDAQIEKGTMVGIW